MGTLILQGELTPLNPLIPPWQSVTNCTSLICSDSLQILEMTAAGAAEQVRGAPPKANLQSVSPIILATPLGQQLKICLLDLAAPCARGTVIQGVTLKDDQTSKRDASEAIKKSISMGS